MITITEIEKAPFEKLLMIIFSRKGFLIFNKRSKKLRCTNSPYDYPTCRFIQIDKELKDRLSVIALKKWDSLQAEYLGKLHLNYPKVPMKYYVYRRMSILNTIRKSQLMTKTIFN